MMNTKYTTILVLLVGLGLSACGDDTDQGDGDGNNGVMDMGPKPDVREQVDPPQPVVPRFVTLDLDPGRAVYRTGLRLLPTVEVFDLEGELITGAEVEFSFVPESAVVAVQERFELLEEGQVTFRVCTVADGPEDAPVCAERVLWVDNAPPTITIIAPFPGEELLAVSSPDIQVKGTVTDSNAAPQFVYVNGERVEVAPDGSFATPVAPRFGVNHLEVTASDGVHPDTAKAAVDVIWARGYEPTDTDTPGLFVDSAVKIWLGQNFIDDGARVTRMTDGTYVTQDLADILELIVLYVDLSSQITNPVVDTSGFTLDVTGITIGKPRIDIDITDTGMELFIQIDQLQAFTEGGLSIENVSLDLTGNIESTFSALARLRISKDAAAPVQVELESLELAIESATGNFTSPEANAIFLLAQSALRTTLENLLLETLEDAFVEQIPGMIEDLLNSLDSALSDQTIDLDLGLGAPLSLELDLGMDRLDTTYRSQIDADMSGTMSVQSSVVSTTTRGVAVDSVDTSVSPFFDSSRIQIALRTVFANGLLHTLWNAGILELDVSQQLPISLDRADLSAKIPPVIRPPVPGRDSDFTLQLGQLEITVELLGKIETYGVYLETGVNFELADSALTMTFDDDPTISTWRIAASDEVTILSPEVLEGLVRNTVYPQLLDAVTGGLSIELPVPSLAGLGAIAAPLANLILSFNAERPVDFRAGYIVIDATLNGSLP